MINPVTAQAALNRTLQIPSGGDGLSVAPLRGGRNAEGVGSPEAPGKTGSFGDLVSNLVQSVDAKGKAADSEVRRLMVGESDNIHRSMISMQEAGVAFSLLVEVRNKLVESYQELMRMPV
jgi:flagellar hook-basal body complex protein FliE